MIVVDASVLVTALADDDDAGDRTRARLAVAAGTGEQLVAPELVALEVLSALRRLVADGRVPPRRATLSVADLIDLPLLRAPHGPLLSRCWELRDNLTPYDAAYVALAEALTAPLLTGDERLANAPGVRCAIELLR